MTSPLARDPALNTKKHLQVWLNMYTKATGLEIQMLKYADVRRLVAIDKMEDALDDGDELDFKSNQPMVMQQVFESLLDICESHALANESIRVLFSAETRQLKAKLLLAFKLYPLGHAEDGNVASGMLTYCDFDEGEAISTVGVRRKMATLTCGLDPDQCVVVDVVCSSKGSGSGRALLGTLLLELLKQRVSNRPDGVIAIAVSNHGHDLFLDFGFRAVKFKGDHLMYLDLRQISFEKFTNALRFHQSEKLLNDICWRRGISAPTRNKSYANGCL